MNKTIKTSLPVAVVAIIMGVIVYLATHWSDLKDRFFGDHAKTTTEDSSGNKNKTSNQDLNYKNSQQTLPGELKPNDANAEAAKIVNGEDPSEPCPTQTNKYRRVMDCPKIPGNVKGILKNMNFNTTQEDCEIQSRTSRITLGNNFIAWTLIKTNSCENKAFPEGLSEEKTFSLKDGTELNFGDHFDLDKVEAYYLSHYDAAAGIDEDGKKCPNPKEKNRQKKLGSLDSELTKAQFRMVDNNRSIKLEVQTFYPAELGKVCSLRNRVSDWHSMLLKDSKFQLNQKPGQIGESE